MAQIGTPSAGWYTDPSGQHRARYWDGASWTEQVRDDLTDPAARRRPAAPRRRRPPDGRHRGRRRRSGGRGRRQRRVPGPTSRRWSSTTGSTGPWGCGARQRDPGGRPAGDGPVRGRSRRDGDSSGAGAVEQRRWPRFRRRRRRPSVETPTPTEPAHRTGARLVSGPGRPSPGSAVGRHPLDRARGRQRCRGRRPAARARRVRRPSRSTRRWAPGRRSCVDTAAAAGPDGGPLSAGQISLASLPDAGETGSERHVPDGPADGQGPPGGRVRPRRRRRAARRFGHDVDGGHRPQGGRRVDRRPASTWATAASPWRSRSVLAVLGAGIVTGRMARFGGIKVAAMGALVAGAAALAVTAVDIADVADRAARLGVPAGAVSNVGHRAVARVPRRAVRRGRRASWPSPTASSTRPLVRRGPCRRSVRPIRPEHAPVRARLQWASRGDVAQLARAPALQAGGRGFESHRLHRESPGQGPAGRR